MSSPGHDQGDVKLSATKDSNPKPSSHLSLQTLDNTPLLLLDLTLGLMRWWADEAMAHLPQIGQKISEKFPRGDRWLILYSDSPDTSGDWYTHRNGRILTHYRSHIWIVMWCNHFPWKKMFTSNWYIWEIWKQCLQENANLVSICEWQNVSFLVDSGATHSVIQGEFLSSPKMSGSFVNSTSAFATVREHFTVPLECSADYSTNFKDEFLLSDCCPLYVLGIAITYKLGITLISTPDGVQVVKTQENAQLFVKHCPDQLLYASQWRLPQSDISSLFFIRLNYVDFKKDHNTHMCRGPGVVAFLRSHVVYRCITATSHLTDVP